MASFLNPQTTPEAFLNLAIFFIALLLLLWLIYKWIQFSKEKKIRNAASSIKEHPPSYPEAVTTLNNEIKKKEETPPQPLASINIINPRESKEKIYERINYINRGIKLSEDKLSLFKSHLKNELSKLDKEDMIQLLGGGNNEICCESASAKR